MNKLLCPILLCVFATPVLAGDVGVSITVGQPGFYGRIDIGNIARPPVVFARPVVIAPSPQYFYAQPIYLHVPPGYEKHWRRHCAEYDACGRPVYFVRDDWYNNEYVPRYRHEHEGHDRDDDRGHGHHGHHHHGKRHDQGDEDD